VAEEGRVKQHQDLISLHDMTSTATVAFLIREADRAVELGVNSRSDCFCA
jgi:hypothetical protein